MNLDQGGFLDRFLVTNQQFVNFLNEVGTFDEKWINLSGYWGGATSKIKKKGNHFNVIQDFEKHPVNYVSYHGAKAYARWAGKSIPSEWLWEKAGRGIDGRTYPWGEELDVEKCNYNESSKDKKEKLTPVDKHVNFASPFGCCDLSGNLWEWMMEWWSDQKSSRVVRGARSTTVVAASGSPTATTTIPTTSTTIRDFVSLCQTILLH